MKHRPAHTALNRILLFSFMLLVYAGAIGFGTVWLRHQIAMAADENKVIEQRIVEIERSLSEVDAELAASLSPEYLIMRNLELDLRLERPSESQIVRISDDVEIRLATKRNQGLFSSVSYSSLVRSP
ncbi:MAG: hypothetical protein DRP71_03420 [Verrucomicrobia bacterium]|nr:MAG: hypothetical protein DRP71_03420 [Verrucomicrobiota bacterium]